METHSPDAAEQSLAEAHLLQMRGQVQEAIQRCRAVLQVAPEEPAALELLGDLEHQQGALEAAAECYQRALAAAPHRAVLEQKQAAVMRSLAHGEVGPAAPHVRSGELIVTTGNEVPGRRIAAYLGIVRGIVVRSPSITQGILGGLKSIIGGNIEAYVSVCESAREEAYERMVRHARERGADAVIGMRYDATEFAQGTTEVLAYGTAIRLE